MDISARRRGDPARGPGARGGKGRAGGPTDLADLEGFYRRHVEDITRFVGRRFDDPHTVADVVADIFLAVVDSGDAYRSAARDERAAASGGRGRGAGASGPVCARRSAASGAARATATPLHDISGSTT